MLSDCMHSDTTGKEVKHASWGYGKALMLGIVLPLKICICFLFNEDRIPLADFTDYLAHV